MSPLRLASSSILLGFIALSGACATHATSLAISRSIPAASASIAVAVRPQGPRAIVQISWKGIPSPSILLVNFDSSLEARHRAQPIRSDGLELYGVTVASRVGDSGTASLSIDSGRLATFFDDSVAIISVRALEAVTAEVVSGDPTVMGGQHVEGVERVRADMFPAEFRLVFRGETDEVAKIFAPASWVRSAPDHRNLIVGSNDVAASVRFAHRLK